MASVLKVVSFGSSKGGLATVGYTVYGIDGAVIATRSTAGVVEIGTSTGIYAAPIIMPDYDAIVLWDTGEGTPKYATEDYQYGVDSIRENTGRLGQIWDKLKNYDELLAALLNKIGILQKNEGLQKINDKVDALTQKQQLSINDIDELLNKNIAKIKLPEFKQPADYSSAFGALSSQLSALKAEIDRLPKSQKEYSANFNILNNKIAELERALKPSKEVIDTNINNIKNLNIKIGDIVALLELTLSKISGLMGNDSKSETRKNEMIAEINKLHTFLNRLAMTKNDMDIIAALGHKG